MNPVLPKLLLVTGFVTSTESRLGLAGDNQVLKKSPDEQGGPIDAAGQEAVLFGAFPGGFGCTAGFWCH